MKEQSAVPVFLVGCPRSGTTWLQLLLSQHEQIATSQETHLFSHYLGHMRARWIHQADREVPIGLPTILTASEFDDIMRMVADRVFHSVLEAKEGASVLLEKTPDHVLHAEQILKMYEGAKFVHLVRDPRSVSASLVAAGKTWAGWAPKGVVEAARMWQQMVERGSEIGRLTSNFIEIRYEDLLRDPVDQLRRLFEWLGLEVDNQFCAVAVDACSADSMKNSPQTLVAPESIRSDLQNVIRNASPDGWQYELKSSEVRAIEYIAGDFMRSYAYPMQYPSRTKKPVGVVANDLVHWLRWRVNAGLDWLTGVL